MCLRFELAAQNCAKMRESGRNPQKLVFSENIARDPSVYTVRAQLIASRFIVNANVESARDQDSSLIQYRVTIWEDLRAIADDVRTETIDIRSEFNPSVSRLADMIGNHLNFSSFGLAAQNRTKA
jgi:hypothetical protein